MAMNWEWIQAYLVRCPRCKCWRKTGAKCLGCEAAKDFPAKG